ncbi:hypothetical protein HZA45_01325 [Candidatus Peregrinibacteria bacterium]|nr:hypothetical protein [Candidatus Peregrinibacteria bacterium]
MRRQHARIFWQSPEGRLRELVGQSFVDTERIEDFRNLDQVTIIFTTHCEGMDEKLDKELGHLLRPFLDRGYNVGIGTGASSGNMRAIGRHIADNFPKVLLIGSGNILPRQVPDFTAHALTLFGGRHRRHRQTNLCMIGDQFLALNGGRGTTGEIAEEAVDMSTGFTPPTFVGLADLMNLGGGKEKHQYEHFIRHFDLSARVPSREHPLTAPWVSGLYLPVKGLKQYARQVLSFTDDPLKWWQERGIPDDYVKPALYSHAIHCQLTGRKPARYYGPAFAHFGIDPQTVDLH